MNEKETNQYKLKILLITDKNIELQQKIDKAIEYTKTTLKFTRLEKDFEKEKILLNLLKLLGDKE